MSGTAAGLMGVAMWSVTTVLIAYITTVPPLELVSLVFFIGALSLIGFYVSRGENIIAYARRPVADYLFWLCTAGFYTILIFIAFRTVPVFEANILNYIWPLALIVFAAVLNHERVTPVKILGGLLGFCGAVAVLWPVNGAPLFADFHWGHGLSLFSAFIWAYYSAKTKQKSFPPVFLAPVFLIFSFIVAGLHFLFEPTVMPTVFEWIIILSLGVFRVSYAMWDYGMKKGDVILLASVSYFLPLVSSVLLAALGFGPRNSMIMTGAVLIVAGCLVVNGDHLQLLMRRRHHK